MLRVTGENDDGSRMTRMILARPNEEIEGESKPNTESDHRQSEKQTKHLRIFAARRFTCIGTLSRRDSRPFHLHRPAR
jgi:hypothetical protein